MITRLQILDNVYLNAIRSDKFKTGCFSVNFLRPLAREEAAQNALIFGVLLAGTEKHPDIRSISMHLDALYGASVGTLVRKKGEIQAVGLYADYVEDELAGEPVFRPLTEFVGELLLSPRMENGTFYREYVQTERQNLIRSMRAALNSKQAYANEQMLKQMCPDEPYGLPQNGEEADLEGVDEQVLFRQYQTLLAQSRVEIFYLGRLEPEAAANTFRVMLEKLPREEVTPLPQPIQKSVQAVRSLEETMPLEQSKLAMGFRAAPARSVEEVARMLTFAVLYGGGSSSKLFLNVREAKSLCYYANTVYDKYKGILRVNSGIAEEAFDEAKQEILTQLQDCADGRFTQDELDTAKRMLFTQIRSDLDSPGRLDEFYLGQAVLDEQYELETLLDAIEKVTRQDVERAAAAVQLDTVFFLRGVGE